MPNVKTIKHQTDQETTKYLKSKGVFEVNMTKEDIAKKIVYSEMIDSHDVETENVLLTSTVERLQEENIIISKTLNRLEEESAMLRELFNSANNELNSLKSPALLVAEVSNIYEDNKAIIKLPNGNKFFCFVSKDAKNIRSGDHVFLDQKSLNVVGRANLVNNGDVEKYINMEKPTQNWKEIGGLVDEIQEIKEVIELPLKKPHLFEKVGIEPPKGILLHGPPGTGKTLLAKAVAHSTNATFIEVVGSELVQKFIGEGAKLVKEIFALARSKAPTIIFIDEIDALASQRMDTGTSGEREVNRTFMQLLAEIDGFKSLDNVKIIGATNRIDILDSAIIRPGRLDRLIEIGLPNEEGRHEILKVHTKRMNLQKVNLKKLATEMEGFTGAEIKAACTESGFFAIREDRDHVTQEDFIVAIEKVRFEEEDEHPGAFG